VTRDGWGPWGRGRRKPPVETEAAAPPPAEAESQFPCPSCGATLSYRPGERVLRCAFCGAETPAPETGRAERRAAVEEQDFEAALRDGAASAPVETTSVAHCDGCGANVEFDPDEHAAICPFCASPIVADPTPDRHIRPQGLLPFALDAKAAQKRLARGSRGAGSRRTG
jgi:LSD1 subclass zinc finger protein